MKSIQKILENSSLKEADKKQILSLFSMNPFSSRSFIFQGDAGVGKTFIAEKLIEAINKNVVYMGCSGFNFKNAEKCPNFDEIIKKIDNDEDQIIFMDDLNYIFKKDHFEVSSEDKRSFMNILDLVRIKKNKIIIVTLNDWFDLDSRMLDRFEARIIFDLPNDAEKERFLEENFKEYLKRDVIDYISKNSVGYNYRDLGILLKIAHRIDEAMSIENIKEAIKSYKPAQLFGFDVENVSDVKLSNISGKKDVVKQLSRISELYKKDNLAEKLGLKRANLLLFHGSPGTGKTYAARALAGEIEFPIILVNGSNVHSPDPCASINKIVGLAKRFERCIVFIDEAEKLFQARFFDDNYLIGEFNRALESADGKEIKAVLILAINDLNRFGDAIQDRFTVIKFGMPSYEERVSFCRSKAERFNSGINYEYLARITKEMSFRDIERLWNELMFQRIEKGNDMDEESIFRALREVRKEEEEKIIFG